MPEYYLCPPLLIICATSFTYTALNYPDHPKSDLWLKASVVLFVTPCVASVAHHFLDLFDKKKN